MRYNEFSTPDGEEALTELRSNPNLNVKISVFDQIANIIKKHGGNIDDYYIHNSAVDHLGFYGGKESNNDEWWKSSKPLSAPVVSNKPFQKQLLGFSTPERGGLGPKGGERKYGLWFTPLKYCIKLIQQGHSLPFANNFTFLVKKKPTAWLQPVNTLNRIRANLIGIPVPSGMEHVGQFSPSSKIAVFFKPAFDIVGKWTAKEMSAMITASKNAKLRPQRGVESQE
jgi:hypothetical protein